MTNVYLFTIAILLSLTTVSVHSKTPIKIGLTGFKPYSHLDPASGKCEGTAVTTTQALLSPYNFEITATCASPARNFRSMSNGVVDLSLNIKSTSALYDKGTFTSIPFGKIYLNLYTNVGASDRTRQIAAVRGYEYNGFRHALIEQGYEFIDVANSKDAIRLFAHHRTTYLLAYQGPFADYLDKHASKGDKLEPDTYEVERLTSIPTHYVISKASKHHDQLVAAFAEIDSNSDKKYHFNAIK